MNYVETIPFRGDFINGKFVKAAGNGGQWDVFSPADLSDKVIHIQETLDHVDQAIEAANRAYKKWKTLSFDERKPYFLRLKEIYKSNAEKIATTISRETGKPLWETRGEAAAIANKIDITMNESMKLVQEVHVPNAVATSDGYIRFKPRGVMAVIGPFNFPAHLPNGHFIPALMTGNTVVVKPSELTPATGQLLAEMFEQAGFPEGVFNLVHGRIETGKRLTKHERVDGVLFTGSYDTGLKISQDIITHYWKIAALEMGGKNAAIVWKDADFEKALYETLFGAYASTGQRCSDTSRIIIHKSLKDEFIHRFHESAKAIQIGHWSKNVFCGPLINQSAVEKYIRFQEIAQREGAKSIMRGKSLDLEHKGHYVSPSIYFIEKHNPESIYEKEEIFGPNVAIYAVDELEEAVEIANDTNYGLSAAIFTKDRATYMKAYENLKVGAMNWNRPTCGASSKLPFGGENKSSNGRPSAHFAVYYCTSPVAVLEDTNAFDPKSVATGITLK